MRRLVKRQVLAIVERMYSAEGGVPEFAVSDSAEDAGRPNRGAPVPQAVLAAMKLHARFTRMLRKSPKPAG